MSASITSLSSFLITADKISDIEEKLETLKRFYEKDYSFQIMDQLNSTLALLKDCCEKSRLCYELCSQLQILENYSEHKDKKKVRLILKNHYSVENLLKESKAELKNFLKKLEQCENYLEQIQEDVVRVEDLVCDKCEGRGYLVKTKYIRERGSPPQPYTKHITCRRCGGSGKIMLNSELKKELTEFLQDFKPIKIKFKVYVNTLENYLSNYEIPPLDGIDDIETIFPEENPNSKKRQQSLSDFY